MEKKKRKKRTSKEVMMAEDEDSDEDCAALKCLKPTGKHHPDTSNIREWSWALMSLD